jgi:hypothetical protein
MIKRAIILLTLLFIFTKLAAPELPTPIKHDQTNHIISELKRLAYESEFNRYATDLSASEGPEWTIINQIGCLGSYQFAPWTLRYLGYGHITPDRFRKDPNIFPQEAQVKLLKRFTRLNEIELGAYMSCAGMRINDIAITRSGILAAAHLGGATGVKMYLQSGGATNPHDANGTSIQDYIRIFAGYDI